MQVEQADRIFSKHIDEKRADALATYRRVIMAPSLSPRDEEAFIEAVRLLNKSRKEVEADVRAVTDAAAIQKRIEAANSTEFNDRLQTARIEAAEYLEESRQLIDQRSAHYEKLRAVTTALEREQVQANCEAAGRLSQLRYEFWEVLGLPNQKGKPK